MHNKIHSIRPNISDRNGKEQSHEQLKKYTRLLVLMRKDPKRAVKQRKPEDKAGGNVEDYKGTENQ